jgi:hypothetical protein
MPRLSDVCEPLRRLTDKDIEWTCLPQKWHSSWDYQTVSQTTPSAQILQPEWRRHTAVWCQWDRFGCRPSTKSTTCPEQLIQPQSTDKCKLQPRSTLWAWPQLTCNMWITPVMSTSQLRQWSQSKHTVS